MLRSEVESVPETGLPLDAFPDKIQEIILNLARYENFNVEYTVSIILSAISCDSLFIPVSNLSQQKVIKLSSGAFYHGREPHF